MKKCLPAIAAILGGIFISLSLATFKLWLLGIIGCGLYAYSLHQTHTKTAGLRGWLFGIGLFGSGATWVYVSIADFANVNQLAAVLLTALFVMLVAILTAIPALLFGFFQQKIHIKTLSKDTTYALSFAAFFCLTEWFRTWFLTGFPWLFVGYSHIDSLLAGWAPVIGVLGIGLICALSGAGLFVSIAHRKIPSLVFSLIAIAWVIGFGLKTVEWTTPLKQSSSLKVALVQANIAQKDKWVRSNYWSILTDYRQLTEPLFDTHDLVIWPESALPAYAHHVDEYIKFVTTGAKAKNSSLLVGLPAQIVVGDKNSKDYNTVLSYGHATGEYNKQRLVPFGEYIPLESFFGKILDVFEMPMSNFKAGKKNQPPITVKNIPIATAICYEIVYPSLVAKNTENTQLILTISNDAWFGSSIGPIQHMQMAQMRALENGRYVIRGTSTGITAIVNEQGKIVKQLPQFTQGVLSGEVTLLEGKTPYNRFKDWPTLLLCLFIFIIIFTHHRKRD